MTEKTGGRSVKGFYGFQLALPVGHDVGLRLPLSFVTSTQAILAQKGKGKTYAASVEAEELLDDGQQIVAIDPTDAWYGLRSSPDGRSTGYPIAVFGGDHGDIALEPAGGAVLAEAIVRERFSAIICTDLMTKGQESRFVADFLETLYRKNREAMHLFIDEADIFAPQAPQGDVMRTCGATDDIVRRGRKKGIGCTLITQRASVINKNVLSQADMILALGCSHPLDLDAIDKWVRSNADPAIAKQMLASLPSLPRGDAWAWNPTASIFKRITIRERRTFDSGATPKAGEKKHEPKILAPVDITRLGASMAAVAQRQRENDPKALKARVAELEATIAAGVPKPTAKVVEVDKVIEKPVIKDQQLARIEKMLKSGETIADRALKMHTGLDTFMSTLAERLLELRQAIASTKTPAFVSCEPAKVSKDLTLTVMCSGREVNRTRHVLTPGEKIDGALSKCERAIMIALAQHPDGLTRKQVLIFTGYRHSGTTTTAFARLIAEEYVETRQGLLVATPRGLITLGPYEKLPVGDALRASLLNGHSDLSTMEQALLRRVCEVYPNPIDRTAARGDYAHSGSTTTAFARLIALNYIKKARGGVVAADELFGSYDE